MADSIDHTDPDARLREVLDGLREDPDALIEIILQQARHIRELTARVEELEETVATQRAEIDRLRAERDESGRRRRFGGRSARAVPGRRAGQRATRPATAPSRNGSTNASRFRWRAVRSAGTR
jgi:uncharacterized small protein (DUF1192 family)